MLPNSAMNDIHPSIRFKAETQKHISSSRSTTKNETLSGICTTANNDRSEKNTLKR